MKKIVKNIIIALIPIIILLQFSVSSYYYHKYNNTLKSYNDIVEIEKACNTQVIEYENSLKEKEEEISILKEQVDSLTQERDKLKQENTNLKKN